MRTAACLVLVAGCTTSDDTSFVAQAVEAQCQVTVNGVGTIDVETDYLPHVVQCENGAAAPTALEAQAVAARSYLYYRLATGDGTIDDGTGDQVYSCGRTPGPEHLAAVEATSGEVLQYQGTQVAAFFVAGALQDPGACMGGTDDPTGTEGFVTYNEGLSGDQIHQTSLGFVDPSNHANRGCLSQNGSDCLARAGRDLPSILTFYYGEDIETPIAQGACITAHPDAGPGASDDADDTGGCNASGGGGLGLALLLLLPFRRRS
jgi:hypothetical protein